MLFKENACQFILVYIVFIGTNQTISIVPFSALISFLAMLSSRYEYVCVSFIFKSSSIIFQANVGTVGIDMLCWNR
jgi:hypothetical protein